MQNNLFKKSVLISVLFTFISFLNSCAENKNNNVNSVKSQIETTEQKPKTDVKTLNSNNAIDELNPFDQDVNDRLLEMDLDYYQSTGQSPYSEFFRINTVSECFRAACPVYALVKKSEQKLYLYVDQKLYATWLVSTGTSDGHETPLLDSHPNGRIYDSYTSKKYPGGDYKGLGNMPYAVFIYNGFAIHGTSESNWSRLGRKASHGCIRVHPDHAFIFNRLVRSQGIDNVWIRVIN